MEHVKFDFKTLIRNNKSNSYLVCPPNYCHAHIDRTAPLYQVSVSVLKSAWEKMISEQPRIKLIYHTDNHYQYIQRSFIFRFPDYINVTFLSLGSEKSTLAIYSYSVYGSYDFGVNKKRVDNWLIQLNESNDKLKNKW